MSSSATCDNFLSKAVYMFILLLPFSIAIAPAPTNVFWAFVLVIYLAKKIILREKLNFIANRRMVIAFSLFLVVSLLSIFNSINKPSSLRGIFRLFQYGLLFLAMSEEIKSERQLKFVILSIVLGGLFASFDAFWQLAVGKDFIRGNSLIVNIGLRRATAAFPNANVLAVYLVPIFTITFGLARYYFSGIKKAVAFFTASIILSAVMLTYSRAAILGCFLSVLILALIKKDKLFIGLFVLIALASPILLPKNVKDWAKSINYNPIIFMFNHDRISVYRNAVNMIKHHPVVGVGIDTFSENYLKYKLPEPADARTGDTMYAHNNFLQIAGEVGLLGFLVFIWCLFEVFYLAYRVYSAKKNVFYTVLSLSLGAALVAFLINGLAETSLYYKRVAVIFWFIVGIILCLRNLTHEVRKV